MLSFRENNPYLNSLKKYQKLPLGVVSEEKHQKRKSSIKKSGARGIGHSIYKDRPKLKRGAKTNQKMLRTNILNIGSDTASVNSNIKMKSPKFLAQVNSKNRRFNNADEKENLPQLSQGRICFQKLLENECDGMDDPYVRP